MKQKIISALFLSGTMLVSNFAFAESVPETATTTTVTESVAAATEESEPTKWEKVLEKLPKLSGYLQTGWNYNSVGDGSSSFQAKRLRLIMDGNVELKTCLSVYKLRLLTALRVLPMEMDRRTYK